MFFGAQYPHPRISRKFTREGAAVSGEGFLEIRSPLLSTLLRSGARKSTTPVGLLRSGERKSTTLVGLLQSGVRKSTSPVGLLRSGARKPTTPVGLLRSGARKSTTPVGLLQSGVRKSTSPVGLLRSKPQKSTGRVGLLQSGVRKPAAGFWRVTGRGVVGGGARFLYSAWAGQRIPNNAKTTAFVILRFRPGRAMNVSRPQTGPPPRAGQAAGPKGVPHDHLR